MKNDKNFNRLIKDFKNIEFANKSDILHKNKGENGLTYYGIYQSAHPNLGIWSFIEANIADTNGNLKKASKYLAKIKDVQDEVEKFYFYNYYLKMKLDLISDYRIVKKIFFFAIVQNSLRRPIRYAQEIFEIKEDGWNGKITSGELNKCDVKLFLQKYMIFEVEYFTRITKSDVYNHGKKGFFRNFKGWLGRPFK